MNSIMLNALPLVDLKQLAKVRRIKLYYIMKRHQLIQLLSMDELPESFRFEKLTIQQLREEARQKGIRGFWNLHRSELLQLLHPHDDNGSSQQQDNDSNKNKSPEPNYANKIGSESL